MPKFSEPKARAAVKMKCAVEEVELIGSGVSGYVYGHDNLAFKVIKKSCRQELEMLLLIDKHPHIVELLKFYYILDMIILQMPFCGQNGYTLTHRRGLKEEYLQKQAMHHLFRGLDYIHTKGILHLDPKPENVFYHSGRWVIGDLGNAQLENNVRGGRHYTCYYRSPMASINMPSKNTDIFATALTVRELITGYPLDKNNDNNIWDVYAAHLHRIDLHLFLKHLSQTNKKALLFITKKIQQKKITREFESDKFHSQFDKMFDDYIYTHAIAVNYFYNIAFIHGADSIFTSLPILVVKIIKLCSHL